jgi:predicted transcriptional regulator
MVATIKQLTGRRKLHSISRRQLQEKMKCSLHWIRWLEAGGVQGDTLAQWRDRYQAALEELIAEKNAVQ